MKQSSFFKIKNTYLKFTFVLVPIICGMCLFLPTKTVVINPKNEPDLIFWVGVNNIPDDDVLEYSKENNVGYMVVLREKIIDNANTSEEIGNLQRAVDAGVDIYICIGFDKEGFFATMNNVESFVDEFKTIRKWLIDNSFYDDIKDIVIDAEIPLSIRDDIKDYDAISKMSYFVQNIPDDDEIEKAEEKLNDFIDLIHDDNKKIGIIKLPSINDEGDGDDDLSRLSRSIYCLEADWDYSITMLYRTMYVPNIFNMIVDDMGEYNHLEEHESVYYKSEEEERWALTLSNFYQKIHYELFDTEVGVGDRDDRYVFIGDFNRKFKGTSYIENKEYQKDLDICRHFEVDKVFFFSWRGFKYHYDGLDGLKELVKHNTQHKKWELQISNFSIIREILITIGISSVDRIIVI